MHKIYFISQTLFAFSVTGANEKKSIPALRYGARTTFPDTINGRSSKMGDKYKKFDRKLFKKTLSCRNAVFTKSVTIFTMA